MNIKKILVILLITFVAVISISSASAVSHTGFKPPQYFINNYDMPDNGISDSYYFGDYFLDIDPYDYSNEYYFNNPNVVLSKVDGYKEVYTYHDNDYGFVGILEVFEKGGTKYIVDIYIDPTTSNMKVEACADYLHEFNEKNGISN